MRRPARLAAGLAALAALGLTLAASPRAADVPARPAPARPGPAPRAPAADPVEYSADPERSVVGFRVRHLGVRWVSGRFTRFAATFAWDPDDPASSWVTATIDAASIDTGNGRRDAHLREEDFLWVARHPTLTFVSRRVAPAGEGRLTIHGDLTIRGVTRPVALDATLVGRATDAAGRPAVSWTAETSIRRQEWGVAWNRLAEAGGFVVGEEVRILLEIEARGPAPPAAG